MPAAAATVEGLGGLRPWSVELSEVGGQGRVLERPAIKSAASRRRSAPEVGPAGVRDEHGLGEQIRGDGELVGRRTGVPGAVLRRAGRDVHRHGAGGLGRDRRGVGHVVPLQL